MGRFGLGQAIRRKEDQRFTQGLGQYTDDLPAEDALHLILFRSPYAHGRITTLDVSEAAAADGVVAVFTAADLDAAGVRDLPAGEFPVGPGGRSRSGIGQPPLARDRVRYVGEPVAAIVAEQLTAARDAAERIDFDVEEDDIVVTPRAALADGAPLVHDDVAGNLFAVLERGDEAATAAAFDRAASVVEIDIVNNRLAPTAMEPRGCLVTVDDDSGRLTLFQGCQGVHTLKESLLHAIDVDDIRVVSPDVGGGFGLKIFLQCETVVATHAARALGRSIKWIAERSESFLSDLHGRDHETRARMALAADGRILGLRADIDATTGAYCSQVGPFIPWFGASMTSGCYRIPAGFVRIRMAATHTVPVDAYRGAGRPEAAYLIERLIDEAARATGIGRTEIRRRNFIPPDAFPYTTFTGACYDSGKYERIMDAALERADWQDFEARRRESAQRGRLRGIGIACYVEICSALGNETVYLRFEKNGRISVRIGTQSTGQGHETSFAQMVADALGVDIDCIDLLQGDTDEIPSGFGTGGSRSMVIAGLALYRGVDGVIKAGRKQASELLEASAADIEFDAGRYTIAGTDRSVSIAEAAAASYETPVDDVAAGLDSSGEFTPEAGTFPNGCHVCEVEIDPATGVYDILRYTIEDDVGVVINPLILEGQIVGGVAQGLGQACGEHAIYDAESGQLVTATFMDYPMPRADWLPEIDFHTTEVPSPRNPLGVKGAGEAGTVGAAPAFVNAVLDALAPRGIRHIDMPVTPHKLWQLLRDGS